MPKIWREQDIQTGVQAADLSSRALAGYLPGGPAQLVEQFVDVSARVEQVKVGHRGLAQAHDYMAHSSGNHHHPQIEDAALVACFGQPVFDVDALSAHGSEQSSDLGWFLQCTYSARIVKSKFMVVTDHFDGGQRLMAIVVDPVRHHP